MKIKSVEKKRGSKAREVLGREREPNPGIEISPVVKEELFRKKEEMERLMSERTPVFHEVVNYLYLSLALTQAFPDDPKVWEWPSHVQDIFRSSAKIENMHLRLTQWQKIPGNLNAWNRLIILIEPMLELDPAQAQAIVGEQEEWQISPSEVTNHLAFLAHERTTTKNWKVLVAAAKTLAQLFPQVKPQMQALVKDSWEEILANTKDAYDVRQIADALLLVPELRHDLEQRPELVGKLKHLVLEEIQQKNKQPMFPRQIISYQIVAADRVYRDADGKLRIVAKENSLNEGKLLPERDHIS